MRKIKLSETYPEAGSDALACWVSQAGPELRCLGPECVAWEWTSPTCRHDAGMPADERTGYCRALPHHPEGDDA